jgi:hypothetical protein
MKAWYFSNQECILSHGDGRRIEPGVTHTVGGPLALCRHGLHASRRLIDALGYAPGPVVWRVELGGAVIDGGDKVVASSRRYSYGFDATEILRDFARRCALDVIDQWAAPVVVVEYLRTGDESWRAAAEAAAWAAARAAEEAATWAAARAAAWAATWAAGTAARAAWNAAEAAEAAAWVAARAAWNAAEAAEAAAWVAARARQNRRLTAMISAARKAEVK